MVLLKSCCGCCSVKSGSYVSAVYTILLSICVGGVSVYNLLEEIYKDPNYHETVQQALFIWWVILLTLDAFLLLSSLVLLAALPRDRYLWFIPWIFFTCLFLSFSLIELVTLFVWTGFTEFTIIFLSVWVLITILNICCLLCVISQYQEVAKMY